MRKVLKMFIVAAVAFSNLTGVLWSLQPSPAAALSDNAIAVCESIGAGADCSQGASKGSDINKIISVVITMFSAVIGVVAVIMIIAAGFKYVTSAGDTTKITSAKNTLIYAIVGLIIVALSQIIVKFVLDKSINGSGGGKTAITCKASEMFDAQADACNGIQG
jgi:lysylphosphatidylglycerol synthetase-like protein (DUF2156 family)